MESVFAEQGGFLGGTWICRFAVFRVVISSMGWASAFENSKELEVALADAQEAKDAAEDNAKQAARMAEEAETERAKAIRQQRVAETVMNS